MDKKQFPAGKGLSIHAVIYVPSTSDVDKVISTVQFNRRIKETEKFLSKSFGGSTRVSGIGSYISSKDNLVQEKVAKVEVFTTRKNYNKNDEKIRKYLEKKKNVWGQEAISYEFEETLYFV